MDEELQKRNTDCLYFLASPLTCKKGMECEYRHNATARLNPRDCWHWFSGNCLNPTCAFRHPPLDRLSPKAAEPAVPKNHGSTAAPVNKIATPCHFYFSSFCNKGDYCQFLHDPDGSSAAVKPLKPEALPSENKSSESETGSGPKILNNNPPAKLVINVSTQRLESRKLLESRFLFQLHSLCPY